MALVGFAEQVDQPNLTGCALWHEWIPLSYLVFSFALQMKLALP